MLPIVIPRKPATAPFMPAHGSAAPTRPPPTGATAHARTDGGDGAPAAAAATGGHSILEITQQPPPSWFKDQFGRRATFNVSVQRVSKGCSSCAEQRHLNVKLLYENGKVVDNQNILRVSSGLCLNPEDASVLAIRIMEVSKNHQNQKFRVQIALPPCSINPTSTSGDVVISDAVTVLSKKNKRPVKADTPDEQAKATKSKKPKHLNSPAATRHNGSTYGSPSGFASPSTRPMPSPRALEFDDTEDEWGSEIVRFKWQQRDDEEPMSSMLDEGSGNECPVCNARYGSTPVHHSGCDLAFLLQQTDAACGPLAPPPQSGKSRNNNLTPAKDKVAHLVQKAHRPDVSARNEGSVVHDDVIGNSPPAFGSNSVDLLTTNLNFSTWEGYSSLSKIIFSLEVDTANPPKPAGLSNKNDLSMGSLGSRLLSMNASPGPPLPSPMSLNMSSITSSTKDLPPETIALLREHEAELSGDASVLRSLSKVSLSDFLVESNTNDGLNEDTGNRPAPPPALTAPALMLGEFKNQVTEESVEFIASVNFNNCGYPALDASFTLVGFYFLATSTSPPDLRFLPNFYPLPQQMLQELEVSVAKWRKEMGEVLHPRRNESVIDVSNASSSLLLLKQHVVSALLKARA